MHNITAPLHPKGGQPPWRAPWRAPWDWQLVNPNLIFIKKRKDYLIKCSPKGAHFCSHALVVSAHATNYLLFGGLQ